ncbi:EAL domain-containing protein [Paraferrimonas haliotis]|uniref:GGDEF domain-containing protein n=1 Tax=Paraferrimonas haliotis TaxID=2013866 RepID=A0AA37TPG7_9GAMM|nr:EAL domain-containing protein [Paraferrimonas haliotis]GLS84478.1 GGDEF domain-containing protein [Paraferrimonas haliotis]
MSLQRQLLALVWLVSCIGFGLMLFVNLNTMQSKLLEEQFSIVDQVEQIAQLSLQSQPESSFISFVPTLLKQAHSNPNIKSIELELFSPTSTFQENSVISGSRAPNWFAGLFTSESFENRIQLALQDGSQANLTIVSNPFHITDQVWVLFKRLVLIYALAIIFIGMVATLILRKLVKPLAAIERQAKAIENRDFTFRSELPKARELRNAIEAINHLSDIIYKRFKDNASQVQSLKNQVQLDPETGISNRRHTIQQIEGRIAERKQQYAIIMLRLAQPDRIRKNYGFPVYNDLVKASIKSLDANFRKFQPLLGRLSENEFCVLIPAVLPGDINAQIKLCVEQLKKLHEQGISPNQEIFAIAGCVIQPQDNASSLLTRVDNMLRKVETESVNGYSWRAQNEQLEIMRTGQEWVALLKDRIRKKAVLVEHQPLVTSIGGHALHYELYARLNDEVDKTMNAGSFLPVIEQFNLGTELDLAVLEDALTKELDARMSLNVSLSTIQDTLFLSRLASLTAAQIAKIQFEFPETYYQREPQTVMSFIKIIRSLNIPFGIDNIGNAGINLDYIAKLRPAYVKLSPALCLASDQDSLQMVTIVCNTVHNLEIPVYATAIENQDQLLKLYDTGIDGFQGYINNEDALSQGEPAQVQLQS